MVNTDVYKAQAEKKVNNHEKMKIFKKKSEERKLKYE